MKNKPVFCVYNFQFPISIRLRRPFTLGLVGVKGTTKDEEGYFKDERRYFIGIEVTESYFLFSIIWINFIIKFGQNE